MGNISIQCSECGSPDIHISTDARWDEGSQVFVGVSRSSLAGSDYCHDCGATMQAVEVQEVDTDV